MIMARAEWNVRRMPLGNEMVAASPANGLLEKLLGKNTPQDPRLSNALKPGEGPSA